MIARRLAAALLGLVLASSLAWAQGDEGEGRRRWRHGQELYQQGRYLDAAKEFEAGYSAAPRPLFLLNIGHAYRRAQELAKAKAAYEKLLQLQPDLPQRAEVEGYIKSIDDALQLAEPGAAEPPAGTTRPAVVAPAATPPPSQLVDPGSSSLPAVSPLPPVAPAAAVMARETPPPVESRSGSVFTKPWFWVIVGAVVAGGVAAGVIASRPKIPCPGTLCIRE